MSDRGTTVSRPPRISASARRRWVRKWASQPSLEGSESSNPLSPNHCAATPVASCASSGFYVTADRFCELPTRRLYGLGEFRLSSVAVALFEVEQIGQVSDRGSIKRDIGVRWGRDRIRKIISAPRGHRRQAPVVFDELEDQDMIGIGVRDVSRFGHGETTNNGIRVPSPK